MKKHYSILIAMVALGLFASTASAAAAKPAFPSWSQRINTAKRFTVLAAFGGAAVLDNETGLVWEQSPDTTLRAWITASHHCATLTVGNRMGWRLPTLQELLSLLDPTQANPALPPLHPFGNVQSSNYWSATSASGNYAFFWFLANVNPASFGVGDKSTFNSYVWCVRGGQGVDPQ